MTRKFYVLFLSGLSLVSLFFIVPDWPDLASVLKDGFMTVVCLGLAMAIGHDKAATKDFDDERDHYVAQLADHRVLTLLEWGSLALFILFIGLYQFGGQNLIFGIIAIVAILYWSLINLLRISVTLITNLKN